MMIPMRLNDVGDLFIKAAQHLNIAYNPDHAYWDAQAWKKYANARDYHLNGKVKYKPDYIAAKVAQNQIKLQINIRKYHIPIFRHVSIDETMMWHDLTITNKTLSLPNQNEPVLWIPNEKETTTIIGVWRYNKFRTALSTFSNSVYRVTKIFVYRVTSCVSQASVVFLIVTLLGKSSHATGNETLLFG